MPESNGATSDNPLPNDVSNPIDMSGATVAPTREQLPFPPVPRLERDLEVVSWLVCSPELDAIVTGYLCDALHAWALAGRGYPQMALPEAGPGCDPLQALEAIVARIPQRIIDAESVADKMDLGRLGRLLSRAVWASQDPQGVRAVVGRELRVAGQGVADAAAFDRLLGGDVL